jgi:hypothetical protein
MILYLPLAVDILELEQAGLQVELFPLIGVEGHGAMQQFKA